MIRTMAVAAVVLLGTGGASPAAQGTAGTAGTAGAAGGAAAGGAAAGGAAAGGAAAGGAAVPAGVTYAAPVPPPVRVLRPFEAPSTPYGPGHRGVDLATHTAETIRAAAEATVRFAGSVAGRGVVVLTHPDGVSTEYEPVRPLVRAGDAVARGQPIGRVDGTHGRCGPGGCLHWGARRAGGYFDPLSLLRPLGPVRLLPWAGP